MTSNWNVIYLPSSADGLYKIGDTFSSPNNSNWRIRRFEGLKIINIDYSWGVRLHFDYNEWYNNKEKHEKIKNV
jgi:hypothetical protein